MPGPLLPGPGSRPAGGTSDEMHPQCEDCGTPWRFLSDHRVRDGKHVCKLCDDRRRGEARARAAQLSSPPPPPPPPPPALPPDYPPKEGACSARS